MLIATPLSGSLLALPVLYLEPHVLYDYILLIMCNSITVGNAAFHSSALYKYLPFSIAFLMDTLNDPDDKTRANGAGALGNLARNGGELCEALCAAKCPHHLIDMVLKDSSIFPKVWKLYMK